MDKIQNICSRQRSKAGTQLSNRGGRPKKVINNEPKNLGPGGNLQAINTSLGNEEDGEGEEDVYKIDFDPDNILFIVVDASEIDMESYMSHVNKMIDLSSTETGITISPALLMLRKTTFKGRRYELEKQLIPPGVFVLITTRCPLLKHQQCVCYLKRIAYA